MLAQTKSMLVAGAAALALSAIPPALAQGRGNGNGNGNGNGGGPPAAQGNPDNGNGQGNANRGNRGGEADRGQQRGGPPQRAQGNQNSRNQNAQGQANRGQGGGNAVRPDRIDRGGSPVRGNGNGNNGARGNGNAGNDNVVRGNAGNGRTGLRDDLIDVYLDRDVYRESRSFLRDGIGRTGLINGCPPGLAKKRNGCLPPGQARQRYRSYEPGFFGLSGRDGRYLYDDGYLLSYNGSGLAGFLPLLGGALGIGEVWPSYYEQRRLPDYYSSYYGLGEPDRYRYADNVIYRVDPDDAAILGIAALLTGDDIQIGQPMPRGYDVYNVPYQYRDRYYDSPQARYRYSDGYVYEIDPQTALVVAAIDLVV